MTVTDLRRGVLVKSEDQGEELLSSTVIGGKMVVGGEKGVLRMWEVGVWDDNEETVVVGKSASADVLAAEPEGKMVGVGMDDGFVRFVAMGSSVGKKKGRASVVGEIRHDEIEGVVGLGWESGGRLISGGGSVVKVWEAGIGGGEGSEEDEYEGIAGGKRVNGFGSEDNSQDGGGESCEEEEKPRKRKKRKKNKGKGKVGGHVMAFKGID